MKRTTPIKLGYKRQATIAFTRLYRRDFLPSMADKRPMSLATTKVSVKTETFGETGLENPVTSPLFGLSHVPQRHVREQRRPPWSRGE